MCVLASQPSSLPHGSDTAYVKRDVDIWEQSYIHKFNDNRTKYKLVTINQNNITYFLNLQ
jgi:hypothetical protein